MCIIFMDLGLTFDLKWCTIRVQKGKEMNVMKITNKEVFALYVKALRARRIATTEGDWMYYNKKVEMFREFLVKHANKIA